MTTRLSFRIGFQRILGGQISAIFQNLPPYNSPYVGDHSLRWDTGHRSDISQIYGIYFGAQLTQRLQAYVDVEMAFGKGVGAAMGLGGFTNGDIIRTGTVDLGHYPYVARYYLRYLLPLSSETAKVERGMDQLPGEEPISRIEIKAGKMSAAADFDQNRYANNTRTQFLDWGLINNTAWDYAADTRGYSYGFVISLISACLAPCAGQLYDADHGAGQHLRRTNIQSAWRQYRTYAETPSKTEQS